MNGSKILVKQIVDSIDEHSQSRQNLKTPAEKDPRFKFRGTRVPILRSIFKENRKAFHELPQKQRIQFISGLMNTGMAEEQLIAINFMGCIPEYFASSKMKQLDKWVGMLYGWSRIDHISIELIQDLVRQDFSLMEKWLVKWSESPDYWRRRLSVVAFVRKIAAEKKYRPLALKLCEKLAFDEEDMVRKGVGWCLQDLMRQDDPRVLKLVMKLRKQGAPSVVISYALRKVSKEIRQSVRDISPQ